MVLGNAQGPAELCASSLGIGMRYAPDRLSRNAGFWLCALQRVLLYVLAIGGKATGSVLDKFGVRQAGVDDLIAHGVGQRDVCSDIDAQPCIRPLGRAGPARVNHVQLGAIVNALEHVMKENRVRLAGVRAPQQDYIRIFRFTISAGTATPPKTPP